MCGTPCRRTRTWRRTEILFLFRSRRAKRTRPFHGRTGRHAAPLRAQRGGRPFARVVDPLRLRHGQAGYTIWGMAGENQVFDDMDAVKPAGPAMSRFQNKVVVVTWREPRGSARPSAGNAFARERRESRRRRAERARRKPVQMVMKLRAEKLHRRSTRTSAQRHAKGSGGTGRADFGKRPGATRTRL